MCRRALMVVLMMILAAIRASGADGGLASAAAKLGSEDAAERRQAIGELGASRDLAAMRLLASYAAGDLRLAGDRAVVPAAGAASPSWVDAASGAPVAVESGVEPRPLSPDRRERILVRDALTLLGLSDPDRARRLAAVVKAGDNGDAKAFSELERVAREDVDARIRAAGAESARLVRLGDATDEGRPELLAAIHGLGADGASRALPRLRELAAHQDRPVVADAARAAVARIERWQWWTRWIGNAFSGVSLGSILVLMALGLAIVFGLMGVINMAHGELMMIGAYATYVTQEAFVRWLPPGAFGWYFVAAIPVAAGAAGLVGWMIEALIVRHLYGRPLETLLATWGVSLVLIQAVRLQFGDNIAVNSPAWLQGGAEVARDIVLPYNRLFIIGFCIACLAAIGLLVSRTRLGLLLRATSQNRRMASSLGVRTRGIDAITFAIGSALAGLAGCALTQVGGVTPDMGKNYVVDSFMVVVAGGVGKLAGVVVAGLGLGCMNKLLEPVFQAVWAKVLILAGVVLLLQWRPSGLFTAKGRLADA